METLAFLHASVAYEDPNPTLQPRSLPSLAESLPERKQVVAGTAIALSMISVMPPAHGVVRRGDTCAAVTDVQTALERNGRDVGVIDGSFGGSTEFAVIQFQRSRGLPTDGVVGASTATALGLNANISCATTPGTTPPATPTPMVSRYRVNVTDGLNIRSQPNATATIQGVLQNGAIVQAGAVQNGFRALQGGGWVADQFLVAVTTTPGTPTPTTPPATTSGQTVRVSTNGTPLNVRSSPNASAPVARTLANGATVRTTGQRSGDWVQIEGNGWVAGQWVVPVTTSGGSGGGGGGGATPSGAIARIVDTNTRPLNVRAAAGANQAVLGTLADGTRVTLSGQTSGEWVQLSNGGWVASRWLR